jgi:hypothetical protein
MPRLKRSLGTFNDIYPFGHTTTVCDEADGWMDGWMRPSTQVADISCSIVIAISELGFVSNQMPWQIVEGLIWGEPENDQIFLVNK